MTISLEGAKIILRKNVSENPNAPALQLEIKEASGAVHEGGLWLDKKRDTGELLLDSNGNRTYSGKIRTSKAKPPPPPPQEAPAEPENDPNDIPF